MRNNTGSRLRSTTSKLSTTNQSTLRISVSEYEKLIAEMKQVKYPTHPIDQAVDIKQKLDTFKNSSVRKQMEQYVTSYHLNSYRRVRGDGNCFFRAVAFEFLANAQDTSPYQCFPHLDRICLTCCFPDSIPKEFQKFYDGKFLERVLCHEWQKKIREVSRQERASRKTLIKVLDANPFLDFIIILYFRAVCLKSLQEISGSELQQYLCGNEQATIRTYSEESEGMVLHLCSRIMQIKIFVYEIRKSEVMKYKYSCEGNPISVIYLLFENSHYDILENYSDIQSEKSVLKSKEYYGELNEKLTEGVCIECGTKGTVYEENSLCIKCYQGSLNNLLNITDKEQFIQDYCSQCMRKKKQVSINYGICKDCLQVQKKSMQKSSHPKSNLHGSNVSKSLILDKCTICRYTDYLNAETSLCHDCQREQKRRAQRFYEKKLCRDKAERGEKATVVPLIVKQSRFIVYGICKKCEYKEKIDEQTELCKECFSKKNSQIDMKSQQRNEPSYDRYRCSKCRKLNVNANLDGSHDCKACPPTKEDDAYNEWQKRSKLK